MKKMIYILVGFLIIIAGASFFVYSQFFYETEVVYKVAYMGSPVYSPFWDKLGSYIDQVNEGGKFEVYDYTPFLEETEVKETLAERIVKENYDAVLLGTAGDENFSLALLKDLKEQGIPIFAIDERLPNEYMTGFVGLDNYESGKIVARYLADKIDEGEKILIVEANSIHETSFLRADGAKEILDADSINYKVIDAETLDWDKNVLPEIIENEFLNEDYAAVFAVWDEAIILIRDVLGIDATEVTYVGFDGIESVLEEINSGRVSATIVQPVEVMAEASFTQIINYLQGKEYEKEKLIYGVLVTSENIQEYL